MTRRFGASSAGQGRGPSRKVWLASGAMVLLAVLMAVVPDLSELKGPAPAVVAAPAPSSASPAPATPENLANQVQVPATTTETVALQPVAQAATPPALQAASLPPPAPPPVPLPAPALAQPASIVAAPGAKPSATADTSANAPALIAFNTTAESWIQVFDAQGQPLLSRVVQAGETVGLHGATPLKVVVGRADVTQVTVRGQRFSMNGIAQSNVARFEVK